jgi:Fic family protein
VFLTNNISSLIATYKQLNLSEVIDYERLNHYAITHHSTFIEGSTLTLTETRLLLEQQLTPKGKPLTHSLMVQNHYEALLYILAEAKTRQQIDLPFLQEINAKVLSQTGAIYRTVFGDLDSSKGVLRKANVSAGTRYFPNYEKVERLCNALVEKLNQSLQSTDNEIDRLILSFDAHFDLVSIHPLYDGNGRTSRLLMNFLQAKFDLPLAIVFAEDKADYFDALEATRNHEDLTYFRNFMLSQYEKYLTQEIENYNKMKENKPKKGGFSLVF